MHLVAYGCFGVLVVIAALVAIRPWPFPSSVTVDQILGFDRRNLNDPGSGTSSLESFYSWRQEAWGVLARGFGALAVAVLLALVGATIDAGKTTKKVTVGPAGAHSAETVTTSDSPASPEVLALVAGLTVCAYAAWARSRAVQREFADDIGRLS